MKKFNVEHFNLNILRHFFVLIILCFFLLTPFLSHASDDTISVLSFNLWNYFVEGDKSTPKKNQISRDAIAETIVTVCPDIIMVSEIGGENSLKDLQNRLKKKGIDYKYTNLMNGADSWRCLGILAKFAPEKVDKQIKLTYKLRPKHMSPSAIDTVPVQRGFLHVVFKINEYKFHIISAHLKAKLFHPRYNHTDMRRLEARLLRYSVDDILKKNPDANILVVGDFNDNYSSSPLAVIRGDKLKDSKKLIDLKPSDKWKNRWTHWWNYEDSYSRIDYTLVSKGLLPEIDQTKCRIVHISKLWLTASDHRPIVTVIKTEDK